MIDSSVHQQPVDLSDNKAVCIDQGFAFVDGFVDIAFKDLVAVVAKRQRASHIFCADGVGLSMTRPVIGFTQKIDAIGDRGRYLAL